MESRPKRLKEFLILFSGILLTGLLGTLIYPTVLFGYRLPDMGHLAWIYLVPLLFVMGVLKTNWRRFWAAFFSAFIFQTGSLYWLASAMKNFGELGLVESIGILFLVSFMFSVLLALCFSVAFWIHEKTDLSFALLVALAGVVGDLIRTHFPFGGFPWPLPAYSQSQSLPFFQWIDVTGVFGLDFLIFLVNGLLVEMAWSVFVFHKVDHLIRRVVVLFFVGLCSFYGSILSQRYFEIHATVGSHAHVALIQGNISQDLKWNPRLAQNNLNAYLQLTESAFSSGADLVVWPETAYPYTIDLSDLDNTQIVDPQKITGPLILGAVTELPQSNESLVYNSALLTGILGKPLAFYHKMHLVPFGEYIPLKHWLTFAKKLTSAVGDFSPGISASLMYTNRFKVGTLICYEDIFSGISRNFSNKGADFLINMTNDAWYGNTSAPYQHLVFSRFRALENRRYVLRATNTGVTALIDPRGEVIQQLPLFKQSILSANFTVTTMSTFYSRFGDWFAWVCVSFLLLSGLVYVVKWR